MNAKWLIESNLFDDIESKMIESIIRSGREVKMLNDVSRYDLHTICKNYFDDEDCVIFYGSINFAKIIQKMPWIPGVYMDLNKLKCTSYYPYFGDELLHSNYTMIPYGDLSRMSNLLFSRYGDSIFIRPDSCDKIFTGTILNKDNFEYGLDIINFYGIDNDELIIVSDVSNIQKEWRFVIVNNDVVSGSLYRDWTKGGEDLHDITTKDIILMNSTKSIELCIDVDVLQYANKMSKLYNPGKAWTLDIAKTQNEYKVIEIGCFSCADIYGSDIDKVVESVSICAENEWLEYKNNIIF